MSHEQTTEKTPVLDIHRELAARTPRVAVLTPQHQRTVLLLLDDMLDSLEDLTVKGVR